MKLASVTGFLRGDAAEAARILGLQLRQQVQFEIYIVQPGVVKDGRRDYLSAAFGCYPVLPFYGRRGNIRCDRKPKNRLDIEDTNR